MKKEVAGAAIIVAMLVLAGCGHTDKDETTPDTQIQNQEEGNVPDTQTQSQEDKKTGLQKIATRPSNTTCLAPDTAAEVPTLLSNTGCFSDTATQTVAEGVIPYTVNSILWADGESKGRYFAIPDGSQISVIADESSVVPSNGIKNGDFYFPVGSMVVKNFYNSGRIVETRFMMNHAINRWRGYSYKWNEEQTDATLLTTDFLLEGPPIRHYYPSPVACMACHTTGAGYVIGVDTLQLNYTMEYRDGTEENYLDALYRLGFINLDPAEYKADRLYAIDDTSITEELRARSYLHSNCSSCHRTGAPQGRFAEFRYNSSMASGDFNVCGRPPAVASSLGTSLISPGAAMDSTLYLRIESTNAKTMMPPVGRETHDETALDVFYTWINGMNSCDD